MVSNPFSSSYRHRHSKTPSSASIGSTTTTTQVGPTANVASSSSSTGSNDSARKVTEEFVQDSFHSYLKSSLTQAKAERLLDEELLSSAEADLMITGPALCLYFAALRSTTNPPSVPLPKPKESNKAPVDLSYENCPPAFVNFLRIWAKNVPLIQNLAPEYQHDLARIICGLEALTQPINPRINAICAALRAVAIEISQRRSFQDRYASALQAALDANVSTTSIPGSSLTPKRASFVPPPSYDAPPASPAPSSTSMSGSSPRPSLDVTPTPPALPPRSRPASISTHLVPPSPTGSTNSIPKTPLSPSILTPESPAIEFIRETLYASLADQLERMPSIRQLLTRDPARAYYGSVAFAVLDVSIRAVTPEGTIEGVLGKTLTMGECPMALRPFFMELVVIGRQAGEIEEEDNQAAIRAAARGKDVGETKLERVRRILEGGLLEVDKDERLEKKVSLEGKALEFANRVNTLALRLTKLSAFRERQEQVFKVLAGIGEK